MTVVADVLAFAGVLVMTIGLVGIINMPGPMPALQAAGVVPVGAALVILAALAAGPADVSARALLVLAALLVTAPLSTHELAKLHAARSEDQETPDPGE